MDKREIRDLVKRAEKGDEEAKKKLKELALNGRVGFAAEHRLNTARLTETR